MTPTQGYLAKFQYGDQPTGPASTTWTDFTSILDIKPPKIEAKDIDVSVMDSPNQAEVYLPGWANGGEAELKIQFDKVQQNTVYGLFRTPKGFRIMFNDGTQATTGSNLVFTGYIKTFQNEVNREGLVTADVMVKVSGLPVFNQAT